MGARWIPVHSQCRKCHRVEPTVRCEKCRDELCYTCRYKKHDGCESAKCSSCGAGRESLSVNLIRKKTAALIKCLKCKHVWETSAAWITKENPK